MARTSGKKNNVRTSETIASKASKALTDGRTSKDTKSLAGSALSNRKSSTKKPK